MKLNKNIIEVIENWNLSYTVGNSLFHILNSKDENFNSVEELKKASWFLNKRINSLKPIPSNKIKLNDIDFNCISLKTRNDRRELINSHLPKFNLKYEFFDAITDNNEYNVNFPTKYNKGQIGCFLSHYKLLKTHNSDKILGILEDDVEFCDDFLDRFKYIEDNFNLDWDIFFLSSYYHLNEHKDRWNHSGDFELTDTKYIHRVYGAFTTHAYLVNPKSINKILKLIDENIADTYAIDHVYCAKIESKLNCYSFTPGMANQRISYSDVDGGSKDPNVFKSIIGEHYYVNNLKDFDYDKYFEKYILERDSKKIKHDIFVDGNSSSGFDYDSYYKKIGNKISTNILKYDFKDKFGLNYSIYNYDYFTKLYDQKNNKVIDEFNEYSKLQELISVLDKSKTIIDIGANCGLFSIPSSLKGYQVYGFEPIRMNLRLLELGKEENKCDNFKIVPKAVSNKTKKQKIYIPYCSDNTSFNKDVAISNMTFSKEYIEENVNCITFDDWEKVNKDLNIGFIKIDVQGFEKEVLEGMSNFLKDCSDVYIYLEWDESLTSGNGNSLNDLESILTENNFEIKESLGNDKLFYKK
jgi:FkbM family methyltransferase